MSRRGSELSEHILYAAKNVFLEMGFERASMDVIALRAQTSKRTLYAHFESKEKLYLAIIELVREMSLEKLKTPGEYSEDPIEALVLFCGRCLEGLLFVWTVRMCRMIAAEAERFPEGAARYFDVLFKAPENRLGTYLKATFNLSGEQSEVVSRELLARSVYSQFPRALFGIDSMAEDFDAETIGSHIDLAPIRKVVVDVLASI